MLFFPIFLVLLICHTIFAQLDPDINRNTSEMAKAHGYICYTYSIQTEDGYLLTAFRIIGRKNSYNKNALPRLPKQPVILQHGFVDTSNTYLNNENPSLAYILADLNFDVWLTNTRGNSYCRKHIKYNSEKDYEFWNYSMDEQIKYDARAYLDFIVRKTGYQKVSFVGHSMGAGNWIAAASEDPTFFGNHLNSLIALSPATSMSHTNAFVRLSIFNIPIQILFFRPNGALIMPKFINMALAYICHYVPSLCHLGMNFIAGSSMSENKKKYSVLVSTAPDSISYHVMLHIQQQAMRVGYYHYKRLFDTKEPEQYNLTKYPSNKIHTLLLAGEYDSIINVKDMRWLRDQISYNGEIGYKELKAHGHYTALLPKKDLAALEIIIKWLMPSRENFQGNYSKLIA